MNERLEYSCVVCDPDWCGEESRESGTRGDGHEYIPRPVAWQAALASAHVRVHAQLGIDAWSALGGHACFKMPMAGENRLCVCYSLYRAARVTHCFDACKRAVRL